MQLYQEGLTMTTSMHVLTTATKERASWTYSNRVAFHCFNSNGLVAAWRAACNIISERVARGELPSGWILAYGSLADYHYKKIMELQKKKRVERIDYFVTRDGLARQVNKIREKLAEYDAAQ